MKVVEGALKSAGLTLNELQSRYVRMNLLQMN